MSETKKLHFFHRNILGDTKATIDAIQKYIKENTHLVALAIEGKKYDSVAFSKNPNQD